MPLAQLFEFVVPDAAKTEFDRDVGMRGAAENLEREGLVDSARAFFQKMHVLIFGVGNRRRARCRS